MKFSEKIKAVALRRSGATYSEIRKKVSVSRSTLSLWLRGVNLSESQKRNILRGLDISREAAAQKKKTERVVRTKKIMEQARAEFLNLSKEPLFLVGLSLYLAEGDKALERVKFTNSDPNLISIIMSWLREICNVPETKFRIALHVHNLHVRSDIIKYWSKLTKIPESQFYALYIKKSTLSTRRNILYNGTCSVIVNSRDLFRRIAGWRSALLENFGSSVG